MEDRLTKMAIIRTQVTEKIAQLSNTEASEVGLMDIFIALKKIEDDGQLSVYYDGFMATEAASSVLYYLEPEETYGNQSDDFFRVLSRIFQTEVNEEASL